MIQTEEGLFELRRMFQQTVYPAAFTAKYDQLECLAHSHGTETFLVCAKADATRCVAKRYDKTVFSAVNESVILSRLRHEGLPEYVDSFEDADSCITVRRYIEGTPLDVYAKRNKITDTQAAGFCAELCGILEYLHTQTPPIIHRDIKPQNIIVKPDGRIVLIDFDIARQYSDGAETDTQCFGTRVYAPPEQYGFAQTDGRTDIYSIGVLLRFLLTGDEKERADLPVPAPYRRIVERCAAFSPKDRYTRVSDVKKALTQSDGGHKKRRVLVASFLLNVLVFFCMGFMIGRYTTLLTPDASARSVRFTEPLIEAAARVQLGIPQGEPMTAEELRTIKELYIFGTEVSATQDAFRDGLSGGHAYERGYIASLSDLAFMPNIERLQVSYQRLEDASGLAALKRPVSVNLMHTDVSDVSALAGKQTLEQLNLFDTLVSDLSCVETCQRLTHLEVGFSLVTAMDSLGGHDTVTVLSLKHLNLSTLNGIERFARLETLYLNEAVVGDADALTRLPALREVFASGAPADALTRLFAATDVRIITE